MASSGAAASLRAGLTGPLAALGVDVEDVEVQKAGRRHVVRIVVDKDGGVDLDLVAEVSRRASELLDVPPLADVLPGPFVLEVTSPGVDRPLTEPRHWRRARTRLVHVTLADGSTLEGRVSDVPDDAHAALVTGDGEIVLALADVSRAEVQVEFNRLDGDDPGDGAAQDDAQDDADDDADDDAEDEGK
jgi:ribosome maturation factor RimP